MRYRQLGRTGLFVSEICLGAATFGKANGGFWGGIADVDQRTATQIVERSIAAGVNFLDTANVYSRGRSEQMVGQALNDLGVPRREVVIATKVASVMGDKPNDRGASRGHIMDAVAQSLERLQTDHIDLYQVHNSDPITPIEETLRALDDLVRQGMVRYVGVSNWRAWRVAKAQGICDLRGFARVETVQAYYNIASRDIEREFISLTQEEGVGLTIWSPLARGFLSGKYDRQGVEAARRSANAPPFPMMDEERAWRCLDVLAEIAGKHAASVATIALAWALSRPFVTSVIIGAKRVDQLEQNLAATKVALDPEDLERLDGVSALPVEYPDWVIATQNAGRVPQPFLPA
jgi:aryl-alcohol dehydrogenase-like predicted oxidoreductase